MTETTCRRCTRPTRGPIYTTCDHCGDELAKALGDVPWITDELEISVTRQKGVDYRRVGGGSGGKKPSERPSPVVWGASEARTNLKAILVAWALFCQEERVRNSSPYPGLPDDNLPALSAWLLWRVDGLTLHEIGADAVEEIVDAVAHCHRLIDRPADRQYLGTCQESDCGGRLYARPGGTLARCEACDATDSAEAIRKRLLDELKDRLCTAAEIAHLSTYLGLKADRTQVRKRINHWHARGQLAEAASIGDEPTFQFGTVYAKLVADEYERTKKSA